MVKIRIKECVFMLLGSFISQNMKFYLIFILFFKSRRKASFNLLLVV